MAKLNKTDRAKLQSVRAKARKGLNVEIDLPKTVTKHFEAIIAYCDKRLGVPAEKLTPPSALVMEDEVIVVE